MQSLNLLVISHNRSFDKGVKLNKQLKLLEIYISNLYKDSEKYSQIDRNNSHFKEFTSFEFENVLHTIGFSLQENSLVFSGSLPSIPIETIIKELQDHRHLNFAEIVEMVQTGQTPPGIKTVVEQPIGANHSVSNTIRPKKPWSD